MANFIWSKDWCLPDTSCSVVRLVFLRTVSIASVTPSAHDGPPNAMTAESCGLLGGPSNTAKFVCETSRGSGTLIMRLRSLLFSA